jgi:tetratricopeptide (TPR) repeat protein
VARDPETGRLGVAVQSHWFSVGSLVPWAEAGVGAVATQSFVRVEYGPELLADLRAGAEPAEALARRTQADSGRAVRQVGVVDAQGRAASFTGPSCIASAGGLAGAGWAVQANIMASDRVVPAMAATCANARGDLAERLLLTLEAAEKAGDVAGALALYEKAERLLPEQLELSFWRGVGLLQQGRREEGLSVLARVVGKEPRWLELIPRLVPAGQLPDDAELLAAIAALRPARERAAPLRP